MRESGSAPLAKRRPLWPVIAVLVALPLAAVLLLASRFYRPIRLPGGHWMMTRLGEATWPDGRRSRDFMWGVDGLARREWDADRDGVYECREDDCPGKSQTRWSACVFYLREGEWVPAPQEVLDCESPPRR